MYASSIQKFTSTAFGPLLGILTENTMPTGATIPNALTKNGDEFSLLADTQGGFAYKSNVDVYYKYSLVREQAMFNRSTAGSFVCCCIKLTQRGAFNPTADKCSCSSWGSCPAVPVTQTPDCL
jgi:hypothetical protein